MFTRNSGRKNYLEENIFDSMKKLDYWTLNEGICLLLNPNYLNPFSGLGNADYADEILCKIDLNVFYRAIETGTLNVTGFDQEKVRKWSIENIPRGNRIYFSDLQYEYTCSPNFWLSCYGNLKVIPFEFLNFVKKKNLFDIPSELAFHKSKSKLDEMRYVWISEKKDSDCCATGITNPNIDGRAERTYLNIIGALLECITGTFKDETFSSETKLREFIDEKFDGFSGVKSRTLAEKFALAKKALNDEL